MSNTVTIQQAFETVMRSENAPSTWFEYSHYDEKYLHAEAQRDYEMFKHGIAAARFGGLVVTLPNGFIPALKQRKDPNGDWTVVNDADVAFYRDSRKQKIRQLWALLEIK